VNALIPVFVTLAAAASYVPRKIATRLAAKVKADVFVLPT
jgi:hypothetical protein